MVPWVKRRSGSCGPAGVPKVRQLVRAEVWDLTPLPNPEDGDGDDGRRRRRRKKPAEGEEVDEEEEEAEYQEGLLRVKEHRAAVVPRMRSASPSGTRRRLRPLPGPDSRTQAPLHSMPLVYVLVVCV